MPKKNKNRYLFAFDLDGTLLKDSSKNIMHDEDIEAIKKLKAEGHIVCIITGRPWRAAKKTYEELELDTIIGNYNGALIHNPMDYNFQHYISHMNLNEVMYILGDKKIQEAKSNLAIEGVGWVRLEKREPVLEKVFSFESSPNLKIGINIHKLPLKPTGVVFDTKPGANVRKLKDYLQRTYGDLVEFSSWSKGDGQTPVIDMTAVGVTKAKALSIMARYYDVPINRTVAIGDAYNDVPMFKTAEISVAMANAPEDIKERSTYVTKKSNREGGVSEFINKFLGDTDGSFIAGQKASRKIKNKIKDDMTASSHE